MSDIPQMSLDPRHQSLAADLYSKLHDSAVSRCRSILEEKVPATNSSRDDFEKLGKVLNACSIAAPHLFGGSQFAPQEREKLRKGIETVQPFVKDIHEVRSWLGEDLSDLIDVMLTRVSTLNGDTPKGRWKGW
jgi:hypothetical protein